MYFSFLLWASTSAALQPRLSSSNVLCFIAIVAIVSFEQINHCQVLEPTNQSSTRRIVLSVVEVANDETSEVGHHRNRLLKRCHQQPVGVW